MSVLNALQGLVNEAIASGVMTDMTVVTSGGAARLLPEGYAFGRLIEYVEVGAQPQTFNGKPKAPAPEMRLGFALWGQGYQEEDGSPAIVRPWDMAIGTNEKSKAFLLFKKLNYKGTAKSFAQLLGEAFLVKIIHTKPKKPGDAVRSVIDLAGFLPPFDPVTKQPYTIPAAADDLYKLFLWERPTKECWDSLFIDGVSDAGKSRNFIQNKCLSAKNFPGSPLESMLLALGMPTLATDAEDESAAPDDEHTAPAGAIPAAPAGAIPAVPSTHVVDTPPFVPDVPKVAVPSTPAIPATPNIPNVPNVPNIPNLPNIPA